MRVLMLAWEWPPNVTGGLGVTAAGLARALARRGISVSVLLPPGVCDLGAGRRSRFETDGVDLIPTELVAAQCALDLAPTSGGIAVGSYESISWRATSDYAAAAAVVARHEAFDLIHAHDWMTYPAAQAASGASGKPWLAHLHSLELDRTAGAGRDTSTSIEAIEREGLQQAPLVLCVSKRSAAEVCAAYAIDPAKTRILHGATDTGSAPLPAPDGMDLPLVLFLGRCERQKGPDLVLSAAAALLATGLDFRVEMIGDGSMSRTIRDQIDECGLGDRVQWRASCTHDEVRAAYARADLVVMPSRCEPFGLVALEAARAERCVIISEAAGVREVLPSAPAVDCTDHASLEQSMRCLITQPQERKRLARALFEESKRQGWDQRAIELEAIYQELAS
ncbi:MAG: glycogen(starch) synthase [Planctomycetota bacterium]|jgi:glycogen(starch) synthase